MKMKNEILKMLRYFCLLFVIVFGLMTIVGTGGGGGGDDDTTITTTTTSTTTTTNTLSQPSEEDKRIYSAWVIDDAIWTLHNLHVAGTSYGTANFPNRPCPNGGTVTITGTVSYSNTDSGKMEKRDLTYEFDNCGCSEEGGSITFISGSCDQIGNWVQDHSQQIVFSGAATMNLSLEFSGYQENQVDVNYSRCNFSISEEMWAEDWSFSGLLCGESFSY